MDAPPIEQQAPVAGRRAVEAKSLLARIFTRHATNSAILIFLVTLLMGNIRQPGRVLHDPDLWWHIADARTLSTSLRFIHVEPYSFTVAGAPWIDPEWLAEMPFWLGLRGFGLTGIYAVTWAGLCANLLFVYWRSHWMARHSGAAIWAAFIGFMLMTLNSGPRTIMIAYLAMSAEMAILEGAGRGNKRLLWLLPPLFCLWVNLHGSWVIGLALLALSILCGLFTLNKGVFDQVAYAARDRNRLLLVLGASVAALMVNPCGWRLVWNPFDMMLNQKVNIANVQEWEPLNLGWPVGKTAMLAIVLMIVANCIRGRKWKLFELATILFAWYAAFAHARFTFLACVLTVPLLTRDMARSFFRATDEKTIPALNALLVLAALGFVAYFFPKQAALKTRLAADYPLASIASVEPSWRTFNVDSLGGMMDFESRPTFLDSRFDTFEHHGVLQDYLGIVNLADPLHLLDKYRIDHALLPQKMALTYLLERTPGWRVEKREGSGDDAYELLARSPGAAAPCAAAAASQHEPR